MTATRGSVAIPAARTAAHEIEPNTGATHAPTAATTPPHAPTPPRGRGTPGSGGPDLAWAAACAGLLLAAAELSMSDEGRHRATRTTRRVQAALRPLIGRR